METLRELFDNHNESLVHKWDHYLDVYELFFNRYRDKEINVLEIGVSQGGSLEIWKKYFGKKAHFFGIDINPKCKELECEQVKIFIGEQEDRIFLRDIKSKIPKLDILIDDGGHTMLQQIITFEEMFDHVKEKGIYLCEDIHTSYMYAYHGGYKKKSSFIEYSKNFIDYINAWHSENKRKLAINDFTKSVYGIHFYTGVVVIEKNIISAPFDVQKGKLTVGYIEYTAQKKSTLFHKIIAKLKKMAG